MHKSIPTLISALAVGGAIVPTAAQATSVAGLKRVSGSVVEDRFGTNHVVIYLKGKKIKEIRYTLPTDRERSARINAQAGPLLRQETLQAQSAHIHVVSGATYTSDAFAQSLQAAINRAHL